MQTQHTKFVECGTDEAGRGCLAGPVTAAAVIIPPFFGKFEFEKHGIRI